MTRRVYVPDPWWEPRVMPVWPYVETAEVWVRCPHCRDLFGWPSLAAAACALVWHTFEQHPKEWRATFGARPPVDSRPEWLGHIHGSRPADGD